MLLKRTMLVGIVAMIAMAFAASSASAWTPTGNYDFEGSLTSTLVLPGAPSLTCDVSFGTTLNGGTTNTGTVNSGSVTNCVTTVPNCSVSVVTNNHPWSLDGVNTGGGSGPVSIYDISYTTTYSGAGCAYGGVMYTVEGDVTGAYDSATGCITFPNASGPTNLEVTSSNTPNLPVGTGVTLSGTVCATSVTKPQLQ